MKHPNLNPREDVDLGFTHTSFDNCRHEKLYKAGKRCSRQLRLCAYCGQYFLEGRWKRKKIELVAILAPLWKNGMSIAQATKYSGVCRSTVKRYFAQFEKMLSKKIATVPRTAKDHFWSCLTTEQKARWLSSREAKGFGWSLNAADRARRRAQISEGLRRWHRANAQLRLEQQS